MKPKIIIVQYFDWAIIGLLAIVLIVLALNSFVWEDKTVVKIAEEMDADEKTVAKGIRGDYIGPIKSLNYIEEFRNRFQRLPVISMFRDNPFVPPGELAHGIIQFAKGQSVTRAFKGARLLEVDSTPDVVEKVKIVLGKYEPEGSRSRVTFTALKPGDVLVKIRDDRNRIHKWRLIMRDVITLPPTRPAMFVMERSLPPFEYKDSETEKVERVAACVLITFLPDNPSSQRDDVGVTTKAEISRKRSGAPDIDYRIVHKGLLDPVTTEQARKIEEEIAWREKYGGTPIRGRKATERMREEPRERGPEIPREAPGGELADRERLGETGRRDRRGTGRIEVGGYAFFDRSVDEGESYVYRIDTLSTAPETEPSRCKAPVVTEPVRVGTFVRFIVLSATADSATFEISRRHYQAGDVFEKFRTIAGFKIGGVREVKVDKTRGAAKIDVDFSTNCIMVGTVPYLPRIDYSVRLRHGKMVYSVRERRDTRVLYVTPRQSLRWKSKEKTERRPGLRERRGREPSPRERAHEPPPEKERERLRF